MEFNKLFSILNNSSNGIDHFGIEQYMPVEIDGWELPTEPHISMSGKANIVETSLVGSEIRGSVKELINIEDYEIKIHGKFQNEEENNLPELLIERLRRIFELGERVSINCKLTDIFDITHVVISSITLPDMIGEQDAQDYEIILLSDEDFTMQLLG